MKTPRRPIELLTWFLLPWLAAAAQIASGPGPAADLGDLTLAQLMEIRIEKVFGASKYEQKVTRAPAAVTIVTADEIAKFGHRTLADMVRSVRGFARPGDFNTRVLLLVDGHRINDNLYGSALIGAEAMTDVDLVERVEVIRGPSSSIYGNSAFFEIINVITRKAGQIDGVEIAADVGSLETRKARATYGKQFMNGVELVVSASVSDSAGNARLYYPEFDTPQDNHGVAVNSDAERAQNFYGRVSWRDFTFSAGFSNREKHAPTASFGTAFNDGREATTDESYFADLKFEHAFTDDVQLATRAYYDRYAYRATYPYNYAAPTAPRFIVLSHDDNHGAGVGGDFQLTTKLSGGHTLVFGGEYRRDLSLQQANYNDNPKTFNFFSDRTGHSTGLYAQSELALRSNLLFSAGLRYDSFSRFGGMFSPRLGLIYNPTAASTLKFLYGQAYRAPNAYELYLDSPGFMKANTKLEPETIRTSEIVYEHYLSHNLRLGVSGYYYDINDLISQQFDPQDGLLVFRNANNIAAKGVEFELEHRVAHGPSVRASYALQRAEDRQTRQELNNSPRHLAKLNAVLPLFQEALHAGVEVQYLSSLKTIAGTRAPGFTLVNLTAVSHALAQNVTLSASVYNLFDHRYAYPGSTGHA